MHRLEAILHVSNECLAQGARKRHSSVRLHVVGTASYAADSRRDKYRSAKGMQRKQIWKKSGGSLICSCVGGIEPGKVAQQPTMGFIACLPAANDTAGMRAGTGTPVMIGLHVCMLTRIWDAL